MHDCSSWQEGHDRIYLIELSNFKANLAESDKVAKTLSGDKLTAYLTEQNQKNTDCAQKKWQTMNNSLIVHSNKLAPVTKSKLTFNK